MIYQIRFNNASYLPLLRIIGVYPTGSRCASMAVNLKRESSQRTFYESCINPDKIKFCTGGLYSSVPDCLLPNIFFVTSVMIYLVSLTYKCLQRGWMLFLLILCFVIVAPATAVAAPATTAVKPIEVQVSLGNEANELKFVPNNLEFVAGKMYKLVLNNPSPQKHYFTAKDFADAIWTQKVQAGKVEVKGPIHEMELLPEGVAEWVFVPMKKGNYTLRCPIPGHTEAGMTGTIAIAQQ